MFFGITSDKFLHFLFYYCLLYSDDDCNDVTFDIIKVLSGPLGLTDEKTLTTFLKLYKKMHQVVNGYQTCKQFDLDDISTDDVRNSYNNCKDILKTLPDLDDKNNKVLQSLKDFMMKFKDKHRKPPRNNTPEPAGDHSPDEKPKDVVAISSNTNSSQEGQTETRK